MQPIRFTITYRATSVPQSVGYFVSIPKYDGGEVVDATYHDKVVERLSTALKAAGLPQHFIDGIIKEAE
jgi:hypothetical protein